MSKVLEALKKRAEKSGQQLPPNELKQWDMIQSDTRVWAYSPDGEAKLFNSPDDIPNGWSDTPTESHQDLYNEALNLGIKIDGRWGNQRLKIEIAKAREKIK